VNLDFFCYAVKTYTAMGNARLLSIRASSTRSDGNAQGNLRRTSRSAFEAYFVQKVRTLRKPCTNRVCTA